MSGYVISQNSHDQLNENLRTRKEYYHTLEATPTGEMAELAKEPIFQAMQHWTD